MQGVPPKESTASSPKHPSIPVQKTSLRYNTPRHRRTLAATLLTAVLAATTAHAATDTWQGTAGSTDWATNGNWTYSTGSAIASGDSLVFTSANAGSLTVNGSSGSGTNSIIGQNSTGTSTLWVNGGSFTTSGAQGFALGNNRTDATGVLTVSSGTATIAAGRTTLQDPPNFIAMGRDGGNGIINLDGGTLKTGRQFVRDGSSGGSGVDTHGEGTRRHAGDRVFSRSAPASRA